MKTAVEVIAAALLCALFFIIGMNSEKTNAIKSADEAYQQGYKDALYKRPVSNDLDMVCAGLWVGQENAKYQKREK